MDLQGSCQFCGSPQAMVTKAGNICNSDLCMSYSEIACRKVHNCGHHCGGVHDEIQCPPCLHNCIGFGFREDVSQNCPICCCRLSSAPIIQLGCSHLFHFHCIQNALSSGWHGPRIQFGFIKCPLCKTEMRHAALRKILEPILVLRQDVEQKALIRLQYEGLNNDPAITSPTSTFYNDPTGFALNKYAYYQCYICKKAYYGGEEECQQRVLDDTFRPEDLMCASCSSPEKVAHCALHGEDFISYKCRYCCSLAVYYCFGTTHFCRVCHEQPHLVTDISPEKLPKCPAGPQGKQLEGHVCPLQMIHPPTGEEFPLGCALCHNMKSF